MKNTVPGAKTGSKPSSLFKMLGQDPSSFFPFWPSAVCAVLWDERVAEHISTQNDSQPDRGHFSASKEVECQTHWGRSPGSAMPQTAGLQRPVRALTIRGHCMYVNAPFCLCRERWVPLGSPSIVATLYQAAGVGHKPHGSPCRTLAPRCLLLPAQQAWGNMSQQSHAL